MTQSIGTRVRDRIDPTDIVGTVLLVAVLYALGFDGMALAALVGILVGVPVFRAVFDAIGVGPASAGFAFGTVAVLAGGSVLLDGGTSRWIGAGLVAFGCWIVLDVLYAYRHGDPADATPDEDVSEAEMFALMGHSRWVIEALQDADRPLTGEEIRGRTGLTDAEFEDVLEITTGNGTVERVGNGYVVDERDLGSVAFVRGILTSVGGRLLRPFRLFRPAG